MGTFDTLGAEGASQVFRKNNLVFIYVKCSCQCDTKQSSQIAFSLFSKFQIRH